MYTFEDYHSIQNKQQVANKLILAYSGDSLNQEFKYKTKKDFMSFLRGNEETKETLLKFLDNEEDADYSIVSLIRKNIIRYADDWKKGWKQVVEDNTWKEHIRLSYYKSLVMNMNRQSTDGVVLYRAMRVPSKLDIVDEVLKSYKYSGVGVYWSYSFNSAIEYESRFSDDAYTYIIAVKANYEVIKASDTLYKAIYPLAAEKEVELYPKCSVELTGIWVEAGEDGISAKELALLTRLRGDDTTPEEKENFIKLTIPNGLKIKIS